MEIDGYNKGYFKAILDLLNLFESVNREHSMGMNTLKKYKNMLTSVLTLLAEDSYVRSLFREYGGAFNIATDTVSVKMKPDGTVFAEYAV